MDVDSRARLRDVGLLVQRLGMGALMIYGHGWPKIANFSDRLETFRDPIGLGPALSLSGAVFAEVFCALAVMLGLATRLAAVPLVFLLLVAAIIVHADDPWRNKDLALAYAVPFLALIFTGAGRYSLDALLWPARRAARLQEPPLP
jgi:putative oxidoreductase